MVPASEPNRNDDAARFGVRMNASTALGSRTGSRERLRVNIFASAPKP